MDLQNAHGHKYQNVRHAVAIIAWDVAQLVVEVKRTILFVIKLVRRKFSLLMFLRNVHAT
jgi:hypothetical protein